MTLRVAVCQILTWPDIARSEAKILAWIERFIGPRYTQLASWASERLVDEEAPDMIRTSVQIDHGS